MWTLSCAATHLPLPNIIAGDGTEEVHAVYGSGCHTKWRCKFSGKELKSMQHPSANVETPA